MYQFTFHAEQPTIEDLEDVILGTAARIAERRATATHAGPKAPTTPQATNGNGLKVGALTCLKCKFATGEVVEGVVKTGNRKSDGKPYRITVCPKCNERLDLAKEK